MFIGSCDLFGGRKNSEVSFAGVQGESMQACKSFRRSSQLADAEKGNDTR